MVTVHDSDYGITVKREQFNGRDCWVARDESGTWRSYCKATFAADARAAAAGMFHADEIFKIGGTSSRATARVKTFIQSNGGE